MSFAGTPGGATRLEIPDALADLPSGSKAERDGVCLDGLPAARRPFVCKGARFAYGGRCPAFLWSGRRDMRYRVAYERQSENVLVVMDDVI